MSIDLTGVKFGRLTAVKKTDRKSSNGTYYWLCLCDCGEQKEIIKTNLTRTARPSKSCGCLTLDRAREAFQDLTGQRFREFEVIGVSRRVGRKTYFECMCTDCGTSKEIRGDSLKDESYGNCKCKSLNTVVKHEKFLEVYDNAGNAFLLDDEDAELLNHYWFKPASQKYIYGWMGGKKIYLHRHIKNPKKDEVVDHVNGNTLDNRRENLRIVSSQKNNWNQNVPKTNKTTGVLGVSIKKNGRYSARITTNSVTLSKTFDTLNEAIKWRMEMELEQRGELAYFWRENKYV